MTSILISITITNVIFMFMSSMTRVFNRCNIKKFEEHVYLINNLYLILRKKEVIEDIFRVKDKATAKARYYFKKKYAFLTYKISYVDDAITDRSFLEYMKISPKDISEIEKYIKPYVKKERVAVDLERIAIYGMVINLVLGFIKIISFL